MSGNPRLPILPRQNRLQQLAERYKPSTYQEMGKEGLSIAKESLIVLKEIRDELRELRRMFAEIDNGTAKDEAPK